jgi:hypothetical protein
LKRAISEWVNLGSFRQACQEIFQLRHTFARDIDKPYSGSIISFTFGQNLNPEVSDGFLQALDVGKNPQGQVFPCVGDGSTGIREKRRILSGRIRLPPPENSPDGGDGRPHGVELGDLDRVQEDYGAARRCLDECLILRRQVIYDGVQLPIEDILREVFPYILVLVFVLLMSFSMPIRRLSLMEQSG